jgi:hypothetical protein
MIGGWEVLVDRWLVNEGVIGCMGGIFGSYLGALDRAATVIGIRKPILL